MSLTLPALLRKPAFSVSPSMLERPATKASVKDVMDRIVNDSVQYEKIKVFFDPEQSPTGNAKMDQCKCILALKQHPTYGPALVASGLNENALAFQLNVVMRRTFELSPKGKIIGWAPKVKALALAMEEKAEADAEVEAAAVQGASE